VNSLCSLIAQGLDTLKAAIILQCNVAKDIYVSHGESYVNIAIDVYNKSIVVRLLLQNQNDW
jgi:hypothetical protein